MNLLFNRPADPAAIRLRERLFNNLPLDPLAWTQFLNLADIELTDEVPTAAVTCTDPAVLKVNPDFIDEHCRDDRDLLLLLLHELHHVSLGHTRLERRHSNLDNIVFDIVINAMITHAVGRRVGTGLFQRFYPFDSFPARLLRPPPDWPAKSPLLDDLPEAERELIDLLYFRGASKLLEGCQATYQEVMSRFVLLYVKHGTDGLPMLLGSHGPKAGDGQDGPLASLLPRLLGKAPAMLRGGTGVGHREHASIFEVRPVSRVSRVWAKEVDRALKKLLQISPDGRRKRHPVIDDSLIQSVLPEGRDRRVHAMADLLGQPPLVQQAQLTAPDPFRKPPTQVHVYLDASGSVFDHLPLFASLLATALREGRIRLFTFSNIVTELRRIGPKTSILTTGGTDLDCVLRHLVSQPVHRRPRGALVITDGILSPVKAELRARLQRPKVHLEGLITPPRYWRLHTAWADHFVILPRLDRRQNAGRRFAGAGLWNSSTLVRQVLI